VGWYSPKTERNSSDISPSVHAFLAQLIMTGMIFSEPDATVFNSAKQFLTWSLLR